jgi:hypothetical protein
MKFKIMSVTTFLIVILLLIIPGTHAIEKELIKQEMQKSIDSTFSDTLFSLGSFLKKMWGLFEIIVGIGLTIGITRFLSILVLPIVLEIGFGPIVYLLLMSALLTIPFELLNGVCLLMQKQFSLGKIKTIILTIFIFLTYFLGNHIAMSSIPL